MKRMGRFLLCLLFNLVMDLKWSVPAWILLVLHHLCGISIWWFVLALGLWIFSNIFWMKVIGWTKGCANAPRPPQEDKNPYSPKNEDYLKNHKLRR